jgi:LmbE family N-acetylglucosaminyl deacetylase
MRENTQLQRFCHFLRWTAYPRVCEGLAGAGRRWLLSRAKDMTIQTESRSCLVLAPHPDDETLACAATIMRKLAANVPVHIVIVTDGRHSQHRSKLPVERLAEIREREALHAGAVLGLTEANIHFLRLEDGRLAESQEILRDLLMPIFQAVNPDEVFVSSRIDAHPDHRALANAARELICCRGPNLPDLYEYPIWFWDPLAWRHGRLRSLQVRTVQTHDFLARKRAAIAAYSSQMTKLTGEETWMTFSDRFLRQFLQPEEIFFKVTP